MYRAITIFTNSGHLLVIDNFNSIKLSIHHGDKSRVVLVKYLLDHWPYKEAAKDVNQLKQRYSLVTMHYFRNEETILQVRFSLTLKALSNPLQSSKP